MRGSALLERTIRVDSRRAREFSELVSPLLDGLYAFALHLSRKPVDAEDLVQETVLKAFERLDQLQDRGAFRSWIFRILYNTCLDRFRVRGREVLLEDPTELGDRERTEELIEEPFPNPGDERALERFFTDEVAQALRKLPEAYRATVLLSDVLDWTYREIAAALGVPVGTVMSRLSRGREQLKRRLWDVAKDRGYWSRSDAKESGTP